jgi:translation initiation factor IF-2
LMKNYTIIYELLDEINDVLQGKALAMEEKIYGTAQILASFPFEKTKVCGIRVVEGRVAKGDKARIVRGEDTIGECHIVSVRQGKNQISKIEKGQEGGIIISPLLDFTIGDMVICHE